METLATSDTTDKNQEKLIPISQECELLKKANSTNKIYQDDTTIKSTNNDDHDNNDIAKPVNIFDNYNNNVDDWSKMTNRDVRMTHMRPLFKLYPPLEKICENLNNEFVESGFVTYIFDKLNDKIDNLKYTINLCGYNLTHLNIREYPFANIMPSINKTCPNLLKLELRFNKIDEQCHLKNTFSNMSHLEYLDIEWACKNLAVSKTLVNSLKQIGKTLIELHLSCDLKSTKRILPVTLATVFHKFNVLEHLDIDGFNLRQPIIESIGNIKSLVVLDLFFYRSIFNKKCNVYPIGRLKNLETLDIDGDCAVTDRLLFNLSRKAKKLKYLSINGGYLTDKGIIALGKLKNLEDFILDLKTSDKENKSISDQSIIYLCNKKLTFVDLSYCTKITNSSVVKLVKNLKNLQELYILNTNVTIEVVEKISKITKYRNKLLHVYVSFEDHNDTTFKSLKESDNVIFKTL